MDIVRIPRNGFLEVRPGKTLAVVAHDPNQPLAKTLELFNGTDRQRRMEESELRHDREPLAGAVRKLVAQLAVDQFPGAVHVRRNTCLWQAVGMVARMIVERRGWWKTGCKGSLDVRAAGAAETPAHNTGGLAFCVRARGTDMNAPMACRSGWCISAAGSSNVSRPVAGISRARSGRHGARRNARRAEGLSSDRRCPRTNESVAARGRDIRNQNTGVSPGVAAAPGREA